LRGLHRDQGGAVALILGLALSGILGFAALAIEGAQWYGQYRQVRTAVDAAAISAAVAYSAGNTSGYTTEATAVAAKNGYIDGTNNVTVAIHRPPQSGSYTSNSSAIEVVITAPQTPRLAAWFHSASVNISARAVASGASPTMCGLAMGSGNITTVRLSGGANVTLNQCGLGVNASSSSAVNASGGAQLNLSSLNVVGNYTTSGGASINASSGIKTGTAATADPYSGISVPSYSGCAGGTLKSVSGGATVTLSPNVYCLGLTISGGAHVTLNPGTYIIDQGSFSVSGGATVTGTGVTIVLTSSLGVGFPSVSFSGGSTVSITAPTSGSMSGIAFYGDRTALSGSFTFSGGTTDTIVGAIYAPTYSLNFSGGATAASPCLQLLAHDMQFSGGVTLNNNCSGVGTSTIGGTGKTQLLE
jgi:hypothetical protein